MTVSDASPARPLAREGEGDLRGGFSGPAGAHPGAVDPATTAPAPGSMTVPFLFQWEVLLAVVVVTMVVAVAFLVVWSARTHAEDRAEWQAWLGARSRHPRWEHTEPDATGSGPA